MAYWVSESAELKTTFKDESFWKLIVLVLATKLITNRKKYVEKLSL